MEQLLKIINRFQDHFSRDKLPENSKMGFYAKVSDGTVVWISLEVVNGSAEYDQDDLIERVRLPRGDARAIRPIFNLDNIGETRPWPQILYPDFLGYSLTLFLIAAAIFDINTKPPTTLTAFDIIRLAKRLDVNEMTESMAKLVGEIASTEIHDEKALPWNQREIFRKIATRSRISGASIDINKTDSDGNLIVDFQDVFVALAPISRFLRIPVPELIVNNDGDFYLEREDPYKGIGIIDNMRLEIQDNIEITVHDTNINETTDKKRSTLRKIVDALTLHKIADSCVEKHTTTIYVETTLDITIQHIYAATVLFPRTHGKKFFMNELGTCATMRSNGLLYYRIDADNSLSVPELLTHVYIEKHNPKTERNRRFKTYTITIDHTDPRQLDMFEHDLTQLLYVCKKHAKNVNLIASSVSETGRQPKTILPPDMSNYTRMYTLKTKSEDRTPADSKRPYYIPIGYAGNFVLSLNIAALLVASYGHVSNPKEYIYVSYQHNLITLQEYQSIKTPGKIYDSFSAMYVSGNSESRTVSNNSKNANVVIPWVYPKNTSVEILPSANVTDLSTTGIWVLPPIYTSSKKGFFDVLKHYLPPHMHSSTMQEIFAENYSTLCKAELFDHSVSEIAETMSTPDSRLHYKLMEYALKRNILVVTRASDIYDRIVDGCSVKLEMPRYAGRLMRDFETYDKTTVILKYYDKQWCYCELMWSMPLTLTASGASNLACAPTKEIPRNIRDEILRKHYYPHIRLFNFSDNQICQTVIELRHKQLPRRILRSQTVNVDGQCTSVSVEGSYDDIENAFGIMVPGVTINRFDDTRRVTFMFVNSTIPLAIPIGNMDDLSSVPIDFFQKPPTMGRISDDKLVAKLSKEIYMLISEPTQTKTMPVTMLTILYQRPMIVLLSLLDYYMLLSRYTLTRDTIIDALALLRTVSECTDDDIPKIRIEDRFVPTSTGDHLSDLRRWLSEYFVDRFVIDEETARAIRSYMAAEYTWIHRNKDNLTDNAIRYINGIHHIVPQEGCIARTEYSEAAIGKKSIVSTWKQYEYAVSRFRARQTLSSWTPMIDLTDADNATDMENYTAFVKRLSNGTVIYGFAIESLEKGELILKRKALQMGMGDNFVVNIIRGYDAFKVCNFASDTVAIFNTSGSITQGSMYRIHVFVSK
jgi:hypothetical protein